MFQHCCATFSAIRLFDEKILPALLGMELVPYKHEFPHAANIECLTKKNYV